MNNATAVTEALALAPVRPLPLIEVQRAMSEYQAGLQAVLDADDWQQFQGRNGPEQFVKRSGWRKIATWFGLDLLVDPVGIVVDRDDEGNPLRARVIGAAVHPPTGRRAEDVGACAITERRFSKPEHDLVSTATTRALNRAISNLVGMGKVSAEEIAIDVEPLLPEWAREADLPAVADMTDDLAARFGEQRAASYTEAMIKHYGYVPRCAVAVVRALSQMQGPAPTPADSPND